MYVCHIYISLQGLQLPRPKCSCFFVLSSLVFLSIFILYLFQSSFYPQFIFSQASCHCFFVRTVYLELCIIIQYFVQVTRTVIMYILIPILLQAFIYNTFLSFFKTNHACRGDVCAGATIHPAGLVSHGEMDFQICFFFSTLLIHEYV